MGWDLDSLSASIWVDLHKSNAPTRVGESELIFQSVYGAESFGIGAGFNGLNCSKIREIEDEDLGLENRDAAIDAYFDWFHFWFATDFYYTFTDIYNLMI
jgi:hypothetical protein